MPVTYKDIPIAGGNTAQPVRLAQRLAVIERHLAQPASSARFLDCGCGAGEYVRALVERFGIDAHGLEYDQALVANIPPEDLLKRRVFQGDLQAIKSGSGEWDYAMLNEVLEHVADDSKVLDEVCRVLRPGGTLFVFSPNRWFPFETHGVFFKGAKARTIWVPFIPYIPAKWGAHFFSCWARNYWQSELRNLVTSCGFSIVETDYVWPTFENGSNAQNRLLRRLSPVFRFASNILARTPFFRRFGLSQVLVCQKVSDSSQD